MRRLLIVASLSLALLAGCTEDDPPAGDPELEHLQEQLQDLERELEQPAGYPAWGPAAPYGGAYCPPGGPCRAVGADLTPEQRHANYGGGSCYYASTCSALENLDAPELAAWIRAHHGGGASIGNIRDTLDRYGVDYVYTARGDWAVLEYAHRENLVAAIEFKSSHACAMVKMDPAYVWTAGGWQANPDRHVYVLDNNHTAKIERYTLAAFRAEWLRRGGRAIVPLGLPLPPQFNA